MCDLLGLSFSIPITAKFSLDIFQKRGNESPDGWGIGFFNNDKLQVIKEPQSAVNSGLFDFMERYIHSKTIISHVRRSTRGIPSYLNTHPFYRRLSLGSENHEFAFAHNGTLTQLEKVKLDRFTPIGETDSEHAFCHLLNLISKRGNTEWHEDDFAFIENMLRDINDGKNTLNAIFSDGVHLFCYSDENDHNNGLRFTKQSAPFGTVEFVSHDDRLGSVDLSSDRTETLNQFGYIISTRILTEGIWTEFHEGELIVFREGKIVYPISRI